MDTQTTKKFDLEERTFKFAMNVRLLLRELPANAVMPDDRMQLSRSSGSIAANYVEANEAISTKDFVMRIKIARKEARESHMWLRLIKSQLAGNDHQLIDELINEALQLVKILNSIASKFKN